MFCQDRQVPKFINDKRSNPGSVFDALIAIFGFCFMRLKFTAVLPPPPQSPSAAKPRTAQ